MRELYEKIKEKLTIFVKSKPFKHFLIFFAILLSAYLGFLNQTLISDNVSGRMERYDSEGIGKFMSEGATANNGRWGNITYYLIHKPLSALGFSYTHRQWIYFIIDLIIFAIALTIIYEVFKKLIKRKNTDIPLFLAIAIIAVNPLMVDGMAFLLPSHPQALLCTALMLYFITSKKKFRYLLGSIFALGAIVTYQSYYAPILILGTLAIYIQNKGKVDKQFIINTIKLFVITGVSVAIQILSTKLYCKIRGITEAKTTSFSFSIRENLDKLDKVWQTTSDILSRGVGIYKTPNIINIVVIILIVLISYYLIKQRKFKKIPFNAIFIYAAIILPILYTLAADTIYYAARLLVGYFVVISAIAILAIYQSPAKQNLVVLKYGLVALVVINIFHISGLITDIQISNKVEQAELRVIQNRIEKYEAETKKTIEEVYVYRADYGIKAFTELNTNHPKNKYYSTHQLLTTPWSDVPILNRTMDRKFKRHEMTNKELKEEFPEHDITEMEYFDPDERIKLVDNRLYWITY